MSGGIVERTKDFSILEPELYDDEDVIYLGRPGPISWVRSWLGIFLFGIPFLGFALFWEKTALQTGSVIFPLFGLPFIIVGLGMTISPLWQWLIAKRAIYAITDKRAIILRTFPWRKVHSFFAADLGYIERKWMGIGGSGTVIFALRKSNGPMRVPSGPDWGFYGIDHPRKVERDLMNLKNSVECDVSQATESPSENKYPGLEEVLPSARKIEKDMKRQDKLSTKIPARSTATSDASPIVRRKR